MGEEPEGESGESGGRDSGYVWLRNIVYKDEVLSGKKINTSLNKHNPNRSKHWDAAWHSACLVGIKPWVQSPAAHKQLLG